METVPVDVGAGDDADADPGCAADDRAEELFTLGGRDLLRVVERRERSNAMIPEGPQSKQTPATTSGPASGAAAGLVGTCDEPCAELPVVGEKLLTYGTRHDSDCSRCRGRRL